MRKILSIVLTLGVILGLTAFAAPVAAAPCTCPAGSTPLTITDLAGPPNFCAGQVSHYSIAGGVTPQALLSDTDKFSVDFPADTDLSGVTATDVTIQGVNPAAITVSGQHLEFVIPFAAYGVAVIPMGSPITITVDKVVNPTVDDTYCLYLGFCDDAICTVVQFDCGTYAVSPVIKDIGCHFDFSGVYPSIAEDYIPPFLAGAAPVAFDFIVRDENGGCNDPCVTPSNFWFEVTACPAGETISFTFPGAAGSPYSLTAADIGVKQDLMAAWTVWPPPDVLYACTIGFSSPGDFELQFFIECPAVGCPTCAGPTVITTCTLAATAYQYMDAFKVPLDEKWNLVSLPLFPFDTSIGSVLGTMDDLTQLVSVWYFDQCEDPAPDAGVWHSSAYTGGAFVGDLTEIQTGRAYWIRTLHVGETGYVPGNAGFWVFGTSSIMPEPPGMDMGYFNVCEGWNMVGFKAPWFGGPVPLPDIDWMNVPPIMGYLWNFNTGVMDTVHYGMIYEWFPAPLPGSWFSYLPGTAVLTPGVGYWIPFDGDGEIYPSA